MNTIEKIREAEDFKKKKCSKNDVAGAIFVQHSRCEQLDRSQPVYEYLHLIVLHGYIMSYITNSIFLFFLFLH
jgi:hypothetical protein